MVKRLRFLALAGALACMAGAAPAASIKAFGLTLGDGGTTLLTIDDLRTPDRVRSRALTDGTAPVTLDALAFRPQTGELYGYQTRSNTVFLVDRFSGMARSVASTPDGVGASAVGFDFNNSIDAARVVSTDGDNLVFNPNNTPPTIGRFIQLFYEDGDANAGATPRVFANAYTNQVASASSTVQYVLDANTDVLATLGNNAGNLATVGRITLNGEPLDFSDIGGFDIFSREEGDNTAYALLTTGAGQGLYLLDLMAGDDGTVPARYLGATSGTVEGLAIAPVPLPAGAWLILAAVGALGLSRRRRSRAAA